MLLTLSRRVSGLTKTALEKEALLGPAANLVGKAVGATAKGLYSTLKSPVGRKVLGTTALVGGMGGAGFMRGAKADQPNSPENLNGAE